MYFPIGYGRQYIILRQSFGVISARIREFHVRVEADFSVLHGDVYIFLSEICACETWYDVDIKPVFFFHNLATSVSLSEIYERKLTSGAFRVSKRRESALQLCRELFLELSSCDFRDFGSSSEWVAGAYGACAGSL